MMKNNYNTLLQIIIIFFMIFFVQSANSIGAKIVDPQLLCLMASTHYERKYNIPKDVLSSISIVESGRWNKEYKVSLAWPWVVGIDGKGNFFNTYNEAAIFLKKAVAANANVDIGCHQVNWKMHGHHFNKPEELLHPKHNAQYAAYFLTQKFQAAKNWNKAIAHYHSQTQSLGTVYLQKVQKILNVMQGECKMHYHNYLKNGTEQIKSYKNGGYKAIAANNTMQKHSEQQKNILVFTQNIELPVNSVIVE